MKGKSRLGRPGPSPALCRGGGELPRAAVAGAVGAQRLHRPLKTCGYVCRSTTGMASANKHRTLAEQPLPTRIGPSLNTGYTMHSNVLSFGVLTANAHHQNTSGHRIPTMPTANARPRNPSWHQPLQTGTGCPTGPDAHQDEGLPVGLAVQQAPAMCDGLQLAYGMTGPTLAHDGTHPGA
eukprot:364669-Chlamydomonas_euryale.AAC.9